MGFAANIFKILPLNSATKKHLKFAYFKAAAIAGIVKRPALASLDQKLEKYVPHHGGVFIEAGANDGVSQSNTWYFENYKNWTGLLIEPLPGLAKMAARFRQSPVVNVALGPEDDGTIELVELDLMSTAITSRTSPDMTRVTVPLRTISSLWDEYKLGEVDLFSLDVEGFELQVIEGLDLLRHRPRLFLIETSSIDNIHKALTPYYTMEAKLSNHDYLFKRVDQNSSSENI